MPMYYFECPVCERVQKRLLSREEASGPVACKTEGCSGIPKRVAKGPSSQIMETLDNGAMVKKVERLADAEQVFYERAHGKKGTI